MATKINFENVGFVYQFWFKVFDTIEKVLPFSITRNFIFKKTKNYSDKWVVFNTGFSLIAMLGIHYGFGEKILSIALLYAILRVFEIEVYQINVLLFHPYKSLVINNSKTYKIQNPFRSVVLLGHNFIEIVFWFTAITTYINPTGDRLLFKLMDNIVRIFTLNYEKLSYSQSSLQVVVFFEVLCGLILTIVSLAKFIGELPHVHLERE